MAVSTSFIALLCINQASSSTGPIQFVLESTHSVCSHFFFLASILLIFTHLVTPYIP